MEKNKGFAFYQNFWDSVENLPEAQQKDIIYSIVRYGITGQMVDPVEDPLGFSLTSAFKLAIDNSVERFNGAQDIGQKGGRPSKVDSKELTEFLNENPNITAKEAAAHFGISESAMQKRSEWKLRKTPSKN